MPDLTMRLQRWGRPGPRVAVSTYFGLMGFISAGWIARIPAVTTKLDLDTAQLGFLLLFIAIGSLVAFQLIGRWIEQYGSDRTTYLFSIFYVSAFIAMALAPGAWVLGPALLLYGFGFGATDVAMNAQGVTVERRLAKSIMGSLHGYFSLGALIGAAISAGLAGAGVGVEANLLSFAIIGLALAIWANRGQIKDEPITPMPGEKEKRGFRLPPRALWTLGVVAFCGAVGEGSMGDWGALYVHDELGASEGIAAFAFTAFSTTMLLARFATDRLTAFIKPADAVRYGGILAMIGLVGGLLPGTTTAAIIGFAVMGFGLAPVFPLVYSAAGSIPGIPSGRGVAAAATMGYTGFLAGPPLLGFVARATSIQASLLIVAVLLVAIPFAASSLNQASQLGHVDPVSPADAPPTASADTGA